MASMAERESQEERVKFIRTERRDLEVGYET
jgi:hypothetical protein